MVALRNFPVALLALLLGADALSQVPRPSSRALQHQQEHAQHLQALQREHELAAGGRGQGLFIAGLEGTGHHVWQQVATSCVESGKCQNVSDKMKHSMLHWRAEKQQLEPLVEQWRKMAPQKDGPVIMLMATNGNMMSYPTFIAPRYPRLDLFSKAAAINGDDLKVVLMLRDAGALQESAHRRFGRDPEVLADAAEVLLKQIRTVPRENVLCVEYERLPEFGHALSKFLSPADRPDLDFNITRAIEEEFQMPKSHHPVMLQTALPRLKRSEQSLRNYCRATRSAELIEKGADASARALVHFVFGDHVRPDHM